MSFTLFFLINEIKLDFYSDTTIIISNRRSFDYLETTIKTKLTIHENTKHLQATEAINETYQC